jgi:hypothetical protein
MTTVLPPRWDGPTTVRRGERASGADRSAWSRPWRERVILTRMIDERDERRRKQKAEERKRQEEIDKILDEPQLPAFEAPAVGTIVDNPGRRDAAQAVAIAAG